MIEESFVKTFIANAKPLNIAGNDGLTFFETSSNVYALANCKVFGCIDDKNRQVVNRAVLGLHKEIICVNLFEKRVDFPELSHDIPWGTYAWFADDPGHYIHFDNTPMGSQSIMRNHC